MSKASQNEARKRIVSPCPTPSPVSFQRLYSAFTFYSVFFRKELFEVCRIIKDKKIKLNILTINSRLAPLIYNKTYEQRNERDKKKSFFELMSGLTTSENVKICLRSENI